jgi:hypothetical protein
MALSPAEVRVERREECWAVSLPGDRIAWFSASERGHAKLVIERKVLRLLAERCTFAAPRIIYESAAGFDLRAMVPGRYDPWGLYEQIKTDTPLACWIGREIGAILVEQHSLVVPAEERWCGRTLAEDLRWVRDALTQASRLLPGLEP